MDAILTLKLKMVCRKYWDVGTYLCSVFVGPPFSPTAVSDKFSKFVQTKKKQNNKKNNREFRQCPTRNRRWISSADVETCWNCEFWICSCFAWTLTTFHATRRAQTCVATALALLHRYRSRRTITEKQRYTIPCGCVLLALKSVESPRKVRDVVNVMHRLQLPESPPLEVTAVGSSCVFFSQKNDSHLTLLQEFWSIKDELVLAEQDILRAVGFNVIFF